MFALVCLFTSFTSLSITLLLFLHSPTFVDSCLFIDHCFVLIELESPFKWFLDFVPKKCQFCCWKKHKKSFAGVFDRRKYFPQTRECKQICWFQSARMQITNFLHFPLCFPWRFWAYFEEQFRSFPMMCVEKKKNHFWIHLGRVERFKKFNVFRWKKRQKGWVPDDHQGWTRVTYSQALSHYCSTRKLLPAVFPLWAGALLFMLTGVSDNLDTRRCR